MSLKKNRTVWGIAMIAAGMIWAGLAAAAELKPPTAEEIQQMEQAAPAKPIAAVQQPRKILIFSRCEGFVHDAIPYGEKAIEILGRKTGAFTVEVSTDMAVFRPENLKRFDAVVFNNSTGLKFEDESLRNSLMEFVRGGKGIIGIHGATDNFNTWPDAAEMMGGLFKGHPWGSEGTWVFKVEDPDNPVAAALGGGTFKLSDEIYLIKAPFSRRNIRVLLSLDLSDPANLKPAGVTAEMIDAPVSWIRQYGQGRVFYCSLGHNAPLFWNSMILNHYLAGIQYALGDLAADATPLYVNWEYFDYSLEALRHYDYGQDQRALNAVSQAVRDAAGAGPVERRVEKALIQFLQSDATLPAWQFICRQLRIIGSQDCTAVLGQMLVKPEMSDMARYALEGIAAPAADEALLAALPKTSGTVKIGIINTLGARKNSRAVEALGALIKDGDAAVAQAAVEALGRIADERSGAILADAVEKTSGPQQAIVCDAYLKCADRLAKEGKKAQAAAIYRRMNEPSRTKETQRAAIVGLIACDDNPGQMILKVLQGGDASAQTAAMGMLGQLPEVKNLKAIAGELSKLSPETQVQLLAALNQRGDASVRDEVTAAARSEHAAVRLAALDALANLGDDSAVLLLAAAAAKGSSAAEQETARQSLYSIRSARADEIILSAIPTAETKVKIELIKSIARRRILSAAEVLFKTAADPDAKVRAESYRSLKKIVTADHVARLIDMIKTVEGAPVRAEAEVTLAGACKAIPDETHRIDAVAAAFKENPAPAFRCSMLNVLGALEIDQPLELLVQALRGDDADVKRTAVRILSDWPNAKPMAELKEISTAKSQPENIRVFAALGYVRMVDMASQITSDAKVELYREAMKAYDNPKVKNLILSELAKCPSFKALQTASEYLQDERLNKEAEAAVRKIAETYLKPLSPAAKSILLPMLQE